MDKLPDELVLHVLAHLELLDLIHLQETSRRYLTLARDNQVWLQRCFESRTQRLNSTYFIPPDILRSSAEARRPQRYLDSFQYDSIRESAFQHAVPRGTALKTMLANWDPTYPDEQHDFYEDYITRNARIRIHWFDEAQDESACEVTATTVDAIDHSHFVFSAHEDGSASARRLATEGRHTDLFQSKPGLLTPDTSDPTLRSLAMKDISGPENVSLAPTQYKAYFAVRSRLLEVDLERLELISAAVYPSNISALSRCSHSRPLIVGTSNTIHMHDPRDPMRYVYDAGWKIDTARFGISPPYVTLEERGPLSILHAPDGNSIWTAGRFTSLLQHSLTCFPRLISTVHSGARMSSMTSMPYPFVPRMSWSYSPTTNLESSTKRLEAKFEPGWTAVCAGEYKGKGSLELYGFSDVDGSYTGEHYQNRQTAARSKLLAVASHSGKYVHADGNGNLTWVGRDGTAALRTYNINTVQHEKVTSSQTDSGQAATFGPARAQDPVAPPVRVLLNQESLLSGSDIVQKIMPYRNYSHLTRHESEKLLLWTGDGRLGVLGYGPSDPLHAEQWHDAVESQVEDIAERARRDAEVQYQSEMRRALQVNADEVRFMRGLGLDA